jgi:hypothetical protein
MRATGRIDHEGHCFSLRVEAENTEEAAVIYEASQKTTKPNKVMGSVGKDGLWALFELPIEKTEISPMSFGRK